MPPLKLALFEGGKNNRYGIVAESIIEVKNKAKEKFDLASSAENLIVQLEDRTIVDDDDYLSCLDHQTCLYISEPRSYAADQVDAAAGYVVDGSLPQPVQKVTNIRNLAGRLQQDMTNITRFSNQDLEILANSNIEDFRSFLHMADEEAESLQEACHSHLVEREKTSDALYLLEIYNRSADTTPTHPDGRSSSKRARK